jgi:diaminohydroxyphosphoribosylaminopyrimidine deaminase/5-amino-6-(5-phosphoribosylamino)uracil reductase
MIATISDNEEKASVLENAGCRIIRTSPAEGKVALPELMKILGEEMKIDSILAEGGGELIESLFRCKLVNSVRAYIAPKIFGGRDAKSPVEGTGVCLPDDAYRIENTQIRRIGEDILIEGRVAYR